MIEINAASVAVFVTILLALLCFACAWGSLNQRVKNDRHDINKIEKAFSDFQTENKADHEKISGKLDTIIRNGYKGG